MSVRDDACEGCLSHCVLSEIHIGFKYEVHETTKASEDGSCEITCGCGTAVTTAGTARQCAYCRGIVTAPFYGCGGQVLEFGSGVVAPIMSCERGKTDVKVE